MTWIWNSAVTICRTLSRILLPKHFNGKDDYDPTYRSFVFYSTLSPNESLSSFDRPSMESGMDEMEDSQRPHA
ncbi:unnamed protein product [Alternaria burnsii]|nr:unnamed protein product [Alternaria burnsii]